MTGERHAGFYTVAMVKAGHVDQWATLLPKGGKVVIELRHDSARDIFLVTETLTFPDESVSVRTIADHFLSDAHHAFTTLTRKYQ